MSKITAIETQKKRGNRKSIFVDGEFVAGVDEEVVEALQLRVGQSFDKETLEGLLKAETAKKALDSALRLLSYRDRSISEIRNKLTAKGYPDDIVDQVIEKLSNIGWLDDQRFSHDWVKSRITSSKPVGRTRLAWELRSKGVDASTVEEALESIDDEKEYELALSLAEKKLEKANRDDSSEKNRVAQFLRRRGFSWDVIRSVIDALCPE